MEADALTWAEACGRMQAVGYRTLAGRLSYRDREEGERQNRFWHVWPDRWRVEDERGVWHLSDGRRVLIRDGDQMAELPGATLMHFGDGHPQDLMGDSNDRYGRFNDPEDFCTPLGSGVEVEVAGRPAWEFRLAPPPRKLHPLAVAVDAATGTVVRIGVPEVGYLVEMLEFVPDVEIPDEIFAWDGPVSRHLLQEREEHLAKREWLQLQEHQLPIPRWWPTGVTYMANDGDPQTGAFHVTLEVPEYAEFARWPKGSSLPDYWEARICDGRHVRTWSDERWQWALSTEQPLSDSDLSKIIESIPDEGA